VWLRHTLIKEGLSLIERDRFRAFDDYGREKLIENAIGYYYCFSHILNIINENCKFITPNPRNCIYSA